MAKSFIDHALDKMQELEKNADQYAGTRLKKENPGLYDKKESLDCILYVVEVLGYAFEKVGQPKAAAKVKELKEYGTKLAKYLVEEHNWVGVFLNPDVVHPHDGRRKHVKAYEVAEKKCHYWHVPLTYRLVNYAPTHPSEPNYQKIQKTSPQSKFNWRGISSFRTICFGFGVSTDGLHTWLYSHGDIFEVKWDKKGKDMFNKLPFNNNDWISNVIVVPPEEAAKLKNFGFPTLDCARG